jgi:hypothetical protein
LLVWLVVKIFLYLICSFHDDCQIRAICDLLQPKRDKINPTLNGMTIPSIETLFLETPLYEKFDFSETYGEFIFNLIFFEEKIDGYCPFCNKQSTFKGTQNKPVRGGYRVEDYAEFKRRTGSNLSVWTNTIHQINLVCTRDEVHLMQLSFYFVKNQFFKIGQYPSIADLSMPELKKYREVLSSSKYKELNRGVGLITHGIGVGAYVYLRRIFEDLIEEAHLECAKLENWNEDEYQRSRMDDKIELLKHSLPTFLVENRKLYGILSKGIHELSEEECLDYFPTVKLAVELILDEKLEEKRRNDKIVMAKKSLNKIHADLK